MRTATSITTTGSASLDGVATPRVLVLGLGNQLLGDDGAGLRLLEMLAAEFPPTAGVEFVDGGTQGLAITGYLADRAAILVLDAMALGGAPGTVHFVEGEELWRIRPQRSSTAHEGNALELFAMARMLGYDWAEVAAIGLEPKNIRTGIGFSPEVEAGLQGALLQARQLLEGMVQTYVPRDSR